MEDNKTKNKFVHLHTHSHYSLLQAIPKIPDLVGAAKKDGMQALALTDSGNLYGAIEFYKECKKAEIKPIIGLDAYVASRTRHDKEAVDKHRQRLVLLAKNLTGYKNLLKLVTLSNLEGFYYKPRIDKELIEKYHEGLICISPSFSGDIAQAITLADSKKALELIDWYKKIFGEENFYIEITHHNEIEGHEKKMEALVEIAKESNTPIVACHDVYYLHPEDRAAREVMIAIQSGRSVNENEGGFNQSGEDFSFITDKQARKLFKNLPEAISNTNKISDMCNLELELGRWVFPNFGLPEGMTPDEELKRVVYEGFQKRGVEKTPSALERVEYELKVIKDKGYSPYFLIVSDLLAYARKNGILSNIRGSVSGSMVTYLAGITNIDPIEYEIPFERFLNPDRPSAPDIDMDFADNRRDEMIDYARSKYGAERVAQIGTFGTMMARGAVRDVARALGFSYGTGDRIAKLIPMGSQGFPMTIEKALELEPELKDSYEKDPDTKTIIDMARKIEGCARHIGVHAAGVVISPTDLEDFTALQFDPKGEGKVISQYDMYSIEEAGLLKFDFLGIKNLSIIADAIKRIDRIENIKIDVDTIPIDDKKTFEMLARGETADLFQLNGDGMTRFLKELRPSTIHDINAMVALYRPGPIQFIPQYIERKHNPKLIKYLDPALEPILKKTYGILVYQDDLLMMAHKLAGYTWGEVDKFRKAVGKKIPEEMEAQKGKFIEGCITVSKWPKAKAEEIWKWIEPFAAYGFNKAHSVSYGRVAYITAYLKANFPEIYLSAVLTADSGDIEKIGETIAECKRLGIPVLPPDINESFGGFTVVIPEDKSEQKKIRFGLFTIKNFGEGIGTSIIEERKAHGKFKSLADFLDRIKDKNLNKKSMESLIKSGAMDAFGERGTLLGNLDAILSHNKEKQNAPKDQSSLFGLMSDTSTVPTLKLNEKPEATLEEKLGWEKELLGLYISGHPLDKYREKLKDRPTDISKIKSESQEGMSIVLGGIIEEAKGIMTKKGDHMMFLKIADLKDSIEGVVFPKVYQEFKDLLVAENCVVVKGRFSKRNGDQSIIVEKIKKM